jgi:hypothetical protein
MGFIVFETTAAAVVTRIVISHFSWFYCTMERGRRFSALFVHGTHPEKRKEGAVPFSPTPCTVARARCNTPG